jgi:mannose-6-phosphate isomerase
MIPEIYPLLFKPILKDRIWGGTKLNSLLKKNISSETVGESWEISTVDGDVSEVANGILKGKSLDYLIDLAPEAILGTTVFKRFGKQFPLLFKFLDARLDLSIQVHPNDDFAQKHHNSFGKTEMWYVMQADENAKVIAGFNKIISVDEFVNTIEEKKIMSVLNVKTASKGDVFFLETGTVHAIGAGLVIAEIQQTSDITYRLHDFDRVDEQGNERELHIDMALDTINFAKVNTHVVYEHNENQSNSIVDCSYFTTNFIPLDGHLSFNKNGNSFTVLMCVDGVFEIEYEGSTQHYSIGHTVLVPAGLKSFSIKGKASVLEIYVS